MTNPQILDASRRCGINQNGIYGLNLKKLNAESNKYITNVSYISNFQILNASWSGIGQNRISELDL